jgi:hypothetical protein
MHPSRLTVPQRSPQPARQPRRSHSGVGPLVQQPPAHAPARPQTPDRTRIRIPCKHPDQPHGRSHKTGARPNQGQTRVCTKLGTVHPDVVHSFPAESTTARNPPTGGSEGYAVHVPSSNPGYPYWGISEWTAHTDPSGPAATTAVTDSAGCHRLLGSARIVIRDVPRNPQGGGRTCRK